MVSGIPMHAEIAGIVRGILPAGIPVTVGMKAGDIDPRCEKTHCFTVSDKALSVAGGVLEAILRFTRSSL
jgi:xanthine dehydrogenase accessory factor